MSYLPIRVNTLRGDQKIDFDVYIKINEKMVLYLRQGDSFEGPRLERFKTKKLKKMFILPDDEMNYRTYVQRNLEMAYDPKSGKDLKTRTEIVHGEQSANADDVFEAPADAGAYQTAKEGVSRYLTFLSDNDGAVGSIFKMDNADRSISHHGTNVATLTVALAQRLGVADAKTLPLMALGALLHDFGHQDSGLDIARPPDKFSREELALYKTHPEKGSIQVQDKKHFDQLVLNIIAQHEECNDGSGFPKGLREKDMDPHVVMVASANAFDRLITFEGLTPMAAGKKLMIEQVGKHPLPHIQKIHEILKESGG